MRSIAISHAFVMGGEVGGSERTLSVGGSEQVNPQVFKNFHYTALGHLHGPQRMGADHIRYSGSPLKYSFDEHMQKKSFTIIDMDTKGNVDINTIPVEAKRDVVILEGYFEDLLMIKHYRLNIGMIMCKPVYLIRCRLWMEWLNCAKYIIVV